MNELFRMIERTATSDASILIVGETGTGKELVAKALHQASRRSVGPFVPVNCAAVQDSLLESELFGHEKGAFTDARTSRTGMFVQAHGGTLFLDEVGEMSPALQPKLLRALQERRVRPVGANTEIDVDVRIVAATNRDLEAEAEGGLFRRDLFYRLNVITITVPPLRVRGNDILTLAQRFIESAAERAGAEVRGVSRKAAERLLAYTWPGNVRELQNAMERAVALAEHDEIQVQDLPDRVQNAKRRSKPLLPSDETNELITLEELEERYIRKVLELMGGNRSMAARTLGLDRTTLYRKLKRYGLSESKE